MFINIIIINYNTVRHCSIENDEIDKQIKRWEKKAWMMFPLVYDPSHSNRNGVVRFKLYVGPVLFAD
jgi:hypothetical protein